MNRRILELALLSLAFAAVCLGQESEDGGEESGPPPWDHNGPGRGPKGPHMHHKGPHHGPPVCPMIHECRSPLMQLAKNMRESDDAKVCKAQFKDCMKDVRNNEALNIVYEEDCLNGVRNMFRI